MPTRSIGICASERLEDILASLEAAADAGDWAMKERDTLGTKSPQTCKVALRQLRGKRRPDRLCRQYADGIPHRQPRADPPRFCRGRARVIIDKDNASQMGPATPARR
ncbi:MAG: enoyl-CoA hydratase/isomerase family protein [Parasphingorhabdus sp.]|nr:enoyl-CoA hydratase/isomerase family protein [Parasphingorhabdus sp.]